MFQSAAKTITVSFYVRSNLTGTYTFAIQQSDNSAKQVSQTYTINSANTWERKTFTFAGDTSGVINDDNGIGLTILWWLSAGSTYNSGTSRATFTAHADADSAVGCNVNILDNTSNNFYLTGVQLEVGSQATDFEHRSFGDEVALCQRYYQVLANSTGDVVGTGFGRDGGYCYVARPLLCEMRTLPSVDDQTTGSTRFRGNYSTDSNTGTGLTLDTSISNKYCVQLSTGGFSSVNNGDGFLLRKQGSSNIVGVDAEL